MMEKYNWNKDKVWGNVEEQLDNEQRRRVMWFWLIGLLLVASVLLSAYFVMGPSDSEQNVQNQNKPTTTFEQPQHSSRKVVAQEDKKVVQKPTVVPSGKISNEKVQKVNSPKSSRSKESIGFNSSRKANFENDKMIRDNNSPLKQNDPFIQSDRENSDPILKGLPLLALNLFKWTNQLHSQEINFQDHIRESNKKCSWAVNFQFNASQPNWQAKAPQNEQIVFGMSQDFFFSRSLSKHFSVFGGLSYEKIWITYDHTSVQKSQMEIQSDSGRVYDVGEGVNYYEPGPLTQTTTVRRRIVNNNSVSRLSIPIGLSYQHHFNRIQLYGNLGTRIRIFQDFDGVITDENDHHLEDIQKIRKRRFRGSTDVGLSAQLGVAYQFSSNWSLGIHYKFKMDDVFQLHDNQRYDDMMFFGGGVQLSYVFCSH